nr:MAG TPA: hypothetical protein [Caudoviricetes sp.]
MGVIYLIFYYIKNDRISLFKAFIILTVFA